MTNLVRLWIIFSGLLCAGGWILSGLHELNAVGYLFLLMAGVGVAALALSGCTCGPRRSPRQWMRRQLRRLRRPARLLFAVTASLSFVGGFLYVPYNVDANAYRIPRLFHWLGSGEWHWIHAADQRLNIAGCGYEWLAAPLIALARSDRLFFLPNAISYVLLPGLIFSVFRRLGVRSRVAWWWMWVLASGWCYALQAGSGVNDAFAAIYALASVDFALRARERSSVRELWYSLAAAALLTGAKQSAIPLALVSVTAALVAWKAFSLRPFATLAVASLCVLCSALPQFWLNYRHSGSWTGLPRLEVQRSLSADTISLPSLLPNPLWGFVGNAFILPFQTLLPPMFPLAEKWNRSMKAFQQTPFGSHFREFENFGLLEHSVGETNATLGLGVAGLTAVSAFWLFTHRRPRGAVRPAGKRRELMLISGAALIATGFFMAKIGTYESGRQMAPYYVFLFPPFLNLSGHARLVRRRWWRLLAILTMLSAIGLLFLDRGRPLFPARTTFAWLCRRFPNSPGLARLGLAYAARESIESQRRLFPETLPSSEALVGYATGLGHYEKGIWFPLWRRRVYRVNASDTPADLARLGIHYVVVDGSLLGDPEKTLSRWLPRYGGEVIDQRSFFVNAEEPPSWVYLVRLTMPPPASPPRPT